jgi:hypothetical protein
VWEQLLLVNKKFILFFKIFLLNKKTGWQNFFICIEMCLAAVALRFAFPHQPYIVHDDHFSTSSTNSGQGTSTSGGRIVTMQTISNNLKETMNPKDIMHGKSNNFSFSSINELFIVDAIHNFHPQYRDYTQYSAQVRFLYLNRSISLSINIFSLIHNFRVYLGFSVMEIATNRRNILMIF